MKYAFLLFLTFLWSKEFVFAQKVGVNKTNPVATLDVGGSINLDSILTVKGVAGAPGQVLMALDGNQMAWQPIDFPGAGQFRFVRYYLTDATFTIPDGVTRIFVEAWGGGGGGIEIVGGASGGYAAGFFNTTAGQQATIIIGAGGIGGPEEGSSGSGGNSSFALLSNSLIAHGGAGITYVDISAYARRAYGGTGGSYSMTGPANRRYFGADGNKGTPKTSDGVGVITTYGKGGDTPGWPYPTGGSAAISGNYRMSGTTGSRPGGGGGTLTSNVIITGANGGPGLVRIWY